MPCCFQGGEVWAFECCLPGLGDNGFAMGKTGLTSQEGSEQCVTKSANLLTVSYSAVSTSHKES